MRIFIPPPSKKGGYVALLLSVGRSVQSVHQQFPFTFFAEVIHTEMEFGIKIYHKNI